MGTEQKGPSALATERNIFFIGGFSLPGQPQTVTRAQDTSTGAERGGNSSHLNVLWNSGWCALGKLSKGQGEQDFGLLCLSHLG